MHKRKRRGLIWTIGLFVLLILVPFAATQYEAIANERAFQEQLNLARKEGIATNAVELAAMIEPAKPEENAAPLYRELIGLFSSNDNAREILQDLSFGDDKAAEAAAITLIEKRMPALEIADRAVQLPRCWFDRDWTLRAAVLFPEYNDMRQAAQLLVIWGTIKARKGDSAGAIIDAKKSMRIARHISEEDHLLSALVGEGIDYIAIRSMATWAFNYPQRAEYRNALRIALEAMQMPDVRRENRDKLCVLLSMIDLSATKAGQKLLGIRESDQSGGKKVLTKILDPARSRIDLVKAYREYYAALSLPPKDRSEELEVAMQKINNAMLAFPIAAKRVNGSNGQRAENWGDHRELNWEARRLHYLAFCRALERGAIAKSIKTSDLLSPFDGKPITYSFDGKQIVIKSERKWARRLKDSVGQCPQKTAVTRFNRLRNNAHCRILNAAMRDRPFETLSGPWTGWSIQEGFRLSERYSLTIAKTLRGSERKRSYSLTEPTEVETRAEPIDESAIQIRGWGTDADGDFSVEGYFLPHDASVFMVRRYVRAPKNPAQVGYPFLYEGSWNGYVIYGTWRASTEADNTGPFEMWPEGEEELDDFMFEEVFKQESLPALAGR